MRYIGVRSREGRTVLVGSQDNKTTSLGTTISLVAALDSLAAQPGVQAIWVVDESFKVTAVVAANLPRGAEQPAFGSADRSLATRAVRGSAQSFLSENALHVAGAHPGPGRSGLAALPSSTCRAIISTGSWRTTSRSALVASLIAFLMGAVTATLSARRITRPVTALTQAAVEMDRGSFAPDTLDPFGNRRDELGRLIHTFQTMAREVQARREHLEALVAERTLDLEQKNALLDEANRRMEDELSVAHAPATCDSAQGPAPGYRIFG